MNFGLLGGIYAMFHAVHGVADYWLQTDWQAQNKSKNWWALSKHILIYSAAFAAVSAVLFWTTDHIPLYKFVALPFVVGLPHMWMDRRRFLMWFLVKTKGWQPALGDLAHHGLDMKTVGLIAAVRTHVAIHMDQKFHYLCLLLTAMWLAYGV